MGRKKCCDDKIQKRKAVRTTIELKKKIIAKYESGTRVSRLAKEFNMPRTTIASILKIKDAIKSAEVAKGVKILASKRSPLYDKMEKLLLEWITEKQMMTDESVSEAVICEKAKQMYQKLLRDRATKSTDEIIDFKASSGWFRNFKMRTGIHSVARHGEATRSNAEGAKHLVQELDSGPELTTIQKSEDDGELETKFDIADLVNIDHEFTSGDPLAEKTGEDDHHDFQENSRNTIPSAENAMSQQQNKTVISTVTKNSGGIVRKRATAAISTNPKRTKIDTLHSASKDALDLFFDGIKSTMRQFSATDIHQVKAKIFSIVSEVEAKYLDVPEMQTADDFELVKVKEELSDYHVQFCDEEEEERNSSVMEERMIKKEVNNIVSNDPLYMGESSGSGKGKVEEDASNKKVVRKTAFCPVWNCCEDNCSVRFSTERQLQMNTEFQNFTSEEKDAYICSLVLVIGDDCKIERTRVYRLPDSFDGSNVDVCKKMFRSVLNLTNKSITNALSKKSWGEYEFHDTLLAEARARQIVLNRKFQI
ncbi:PREDICTED: uncharacterized protein LOC108559909 isoform X1 [Nicrophorus vespilloides]|uniref:Uncharacterized protein LOC108559909 isoform X1 n=1 Tax=Nicrophorus vespilloides TaxID=110193 RepID=A0ABM1MDX8_NICVS|nr:PREDICTED: uncharacterized protein LOC108559909 isoform X1 [Nicrophorus vespilloides]